MNQLDLVTRLRAVEALWETFQKDLPEGAGAVAADLAALAGEVDATYRNLQALDNLANAVGRGVLLEDVLNDIFDGFRAVIPYDRIGFALIDEGNVTARWARSDFERVELFVGYSLPLENTTLGSILEAKKPRIINDLVAYLEERPDSESTRLLIDEGVRSSLTCPLFVEGQPVGFLFFSSDEVGTYSDVHTATFERIAGQIAAVIEKGRLTSELAERADDIERQNDELRRLNDVKNTFIGMASHDLRSPLATIQMTADLLDAADHLAPDERKMFIKDIKEQAGYMLSLVNELLDVAQIESGKLELEIDRVDLDSLIDSAILRYRLLASAKQIEVGYSRAGAITVDVDPTRIRQVIDNLLSNAVKYSPFASKVTVGTAVTADAVTVTVDDEGPGVAPEDRVRLFDYFEKSTAQPTGGEMSTGLGLAIARRIIDAHGGSIGVDDSPGGGARFWFELPPAR